MKITEVVLIEKIARAKLRLEDMKRGHKSSCIVENDPEGLKPCNCGASELNSQIVKVIKELIIE